MKKLRNQGTTVVFVSHNLDQVARFCSRALVLEKGQIRYDGGPHEALRRYRNAVVSSVHLTGGSLYPNAKASNDVTIEKILIQSHANNNGDPIVEYRKSLRIAIELAIHNPPKEIHCHLKFRQIETGFECAATTKDNRTLVVDKHTTIVAEIDQLPLTAGIYMVEAYITDPEHIVDYAEYRGQGFEVTSDNGLGRQFGINVIAANWSVHQV
jgi:ABC-2 type transport system ATP-binding protein